MTINDLFARCGDLPGTTELIALLPTKKGNIVKEIADIRTKAIEDTAVLLISTDPLSKIQEEMVNG